jgi:hypothetical protein
MRTSSANETSKNEPVVRYNSDEALSRLAEGQGAEGRLQNRLRMLPKVDKNGFSACAFASALFAQAEEAVPDVLMTMGRVRSYIPVIEKEIQVAKRNWEEITEKFSALHNEEPKNELHKAEQQAHRWLAKLRREREDFGKLLAFMERTLKESQAKKYPGGKPSNMQAPLTPLVPAQALPPIPSSVPSLPMTPSFRAASLTMPVASVSLPPLLASHAEPVGIPPLPPIFLGPLRGPQGPLW